ncbi:hypothetical protein BC829DRAFT_136955 [Chytridium lagenaria]|nr:hypothetical protein BC829DRAFT_136955 [Chytridium lagenaria]
MNAEDMKDIDGGGNAGEIEGISERNVGEMNEIKGISLVIEDLKEIDVKELKEIDGIAEKVADHMKEREALESTEHEPISDVKDVKEMNPHQEALPDQGEDDQGAKTEAKGIHHHYLDRQDSKLPDEEEVLIRGLAERYGELRDPRAFVGGEVKVGGGMRRNWRDGRRGRGAWRD